MACSETGGEPIHSRMAIPLRCLWLLYPLACLKRLWFVLVLGSFFNWWVIVDQRWSLIAWASATLRCGLRPDCLRSFTPCGFPSKCKTKSRGCFYKTNRGGHWCCGMNWVLGHAVRVENHSIATAEPEVDLVSCQGGSRWRGATEQSAAEEWGTAFPRYSKTLDCE